MMVRVGGHADNNRKGRTMREQVPDPAVVTAIAREAHAEGRGAVDAVVEWYGDWERNQARLADREREHSVRQVVDAPENFIEVPEPAADQWECGWCYKRTLWSDRHIVDGQSFHRRCWELRQGNINIARAMNGFFGAE